MKTLWIAALAMAMAFTAGAAVAAANCKAQLEILPDVRASELDARAGSAKISIYPVCLRSEAGDLRAEGNAGGLIRTIAGNEILSAALADEDFVADDVVGVRLGGGGSIILYVHPSR